jgi:hypothetical protein
MSGNGPTQGAWRDRIRSILGGDRAGVSAKPNRSGIDPSRIDVWPTGFPNAETTRQSRALEQFLVTLRDQPPSAILDLGGANQANISYLTSLGHRLTSENVLSSLDTVWGDPNLSESRKIEDFLEQTLNYQDCSFGGVLVWDTLQFLPQPLLEAVVHRLSGLLVSGAQVLAYTPADERSRIIPSYAYRIVDWRTIQIQPRELRPRETYFNNRSVERLFQDFSAVKFFLTRDHLREIVVKR